MGEDELLEVLRGIRKSMREFYKVFVGNERESGREAEFEKIYKPESIMTETICRLYGVSTDSDLAIDWINYRVINFDSFIKIYGCPKVNKK